MGFGGAFLWGFEGILWQRIRWALFINIFKVYLGISWGLGFWEEATATVSLPLQSSQFQSGFLQSPEGLTLLL